MHCLTAEVFAKENMPVGLKVGIHMLFDVLCDLDTFLLELVLSELLFSDADNGL